MKHIFLLSIMVAMVVTVSAADKNRNTDGGGYGQVTKMLQKQMSNSSLNGKNNDYLNPKGYHPVGGTGSKNSNRRRS